MSQSPRRGISREGVDQTFAADEIRNSELLLAAQMLRAQGQCEEAATKLAEAAAIEEQLSERCASAGLPEKSRVHQFSAASCWAQAGNFYRAVSLCDDLLAQPDLPVRLREHVRNYVEKLRERRAQWYADLELTSAGADA